MVVTRKTFSLFSLACLIGLTPLYSKADYLINEPSCECNLMRKVKLVTHHKCHHHKKKKIRRHHRRVRRACRETCILHYIPQHEPVDFRWGQPAPCGHYVNLEDCESYDPDRITGDDDPTIYPGMNIDN